MKQYLELLKDVLENGEEREERTGTGTISVFGRQIRFDLRQGFPLVTTKKINLKAVVHELLWFLKGGTNIKYLNDNGVHIWDAWADENGDLGPIYGSQWRNWITYEYIGGSDFHDGDPIDQIANVIKSLKENPTSRRHIVATWNVAEIDNMRLPPCHGIAIQFYVSNKKELSCQMYQRSNDLFLGNPFNTASYAILVHMIAQVCNLNVGELIITIGDAHIYKDHIEQVKLQLTRTPHDLPKLVLNKEIKNIDDFTFDDIKIENYQHDPVIKGKISV